MLAIVISSHLILKEVHNDQLEEDSTLVVMSTRLDVLVIQFICCLYRLAFVQHHFQQVMICITRRLITPCS